MGAVAAEAEGRGAPAAVAAGQVRFELPALHSCCAVVSVHGQLLYSWLQPCANVSLCPSSSPDARLDALGFRWSLTDAEAKWHHMFHSLRRYRAAHGDVAVAPDYVNRDEYDWMVAARWLKRQARLYAKQKLPEERQKLLASLGVTLRLPRRLLGRYATLRGLNVHERKLQRRRWRDADMAEAEGRRAARAAARAAAAGRRAEARELEERRRGVQLLATSERPLMSAWMAPDERLPEPVPVERSGAAATSSRTSTSSSSSSHRRLRVDEPPVTTTETGRSRSSSNSSSQQQLLDPPVFNPRGSSQEQQQQQQQQPAAAAEPPQPRQAAAVATQQGAAVQAPASRATHQLPPQPPGATGLEQPAAASAPQHQLTPSAGEAKASAAAAAGAPVHHSSNRRHRRRQKELSREEIWRQRRVDPD